MTLEFNDYGSFENYLQHINFMLVNKWVNKLRDSNPPEGTKIDDIPGQKELYDDIYRFRYFCKKYFGYEMYPAGHPKEFQFHFIGDCENER